MLGTNQKVWCVGYICYVSYPNYHSYPRYAGYAPPTGTRFDHSNKDTFFLVFYHRV